MSSAKATGTRLPITVTAVCVLPADMAPPTSPNGVVCFTMPPIHRSASAVLPLGVTVTVRCQFCPSVAVCPLLTGIRASALLRLFRRSPWRVRLATHSADHDRSEEHTSELQSLRHLVCRLLLE